MRHNNNRRMKNRNGGSNGGGQHRPRGNNVPPRMQVFDSNGPDVRIRGTAWQVHEKYLALAKDANSAGDLIMAENYLQHAEHYQRMINTFTEQMGEYAPRQHNQADEGAEMDGNVTDHVIPVQQVQQPRRDEARREEPRRNDADLGLPTNLFKPAAPSGQLETA